MSLLDDVSIVVTPNGYKAGTLFAVKPTIAYGSELVVNGDFSQGNTGWTIEAVWTISGGAAHGNGASGSSQELKQAILEVGKTYEFSYEIRNRVSGSVELLNSGLGSTSSNEVYKSIGIATSTELRFRPSSFNGDIYNVSVREFTGADMDVTRATAATRVDENGLVNYAEVLGGEEVTGFTNGTTYPFSTFTTSGNNITSAIISSSFAGAVSNSISIVNGKTYKVTFTYTKNSGDDLRVLISNAISGASASISNIEQVSASGDITLFLTATSTATGYLQMGTGSGSDSLDISITNISVKEVTRDNVPRIDYTGGGCPHILAEPERTNLIPYSEDFSSNWTTSNLSVVEHSTTSPSGETNADKLKEDSSNSSHTIRYGSPNTPVTNGAVYTMSFFAKKEERTSIRFSNAAMSSTDGKFNLSNGQVISSGSSATNSMVDYGNGWYRCIMTFTSTSTIAQANISILNANDDITYQGDGSSGLYVWGVQIEAGSYATSYIPNFGTALGVTRNQDIFTRDGIGSLINSTEGVLFVEMAALSDDLTFRSISLNDGTNTNSVGIRYRTDSNRINAIIKDDNGVTFQMNFDVSDITQFNKIALKYKSGDNSLYINGTEVSTNSSTFSFTSALNDASFNRGDGNDEFFGKVKQLQVYNTALGGSPYDATLSDARLAALTS
jgi:hypothetical protein